MVPAIGAVCAVQEKQTTDRLSQYSKSYGTRERNHHDKTHGRIDLFPDFFISFCAKDIVSVGTQEAAIAEAMEIGTLISSLYFPEKRPTRHQSCFQSIPAITQHF